MKIISTEKLPEKAKEFLNVKDENIEEDLKDAEALLTWPSKAAQYIPRMPKLKVIQTFSAGVDDFPFHLLPPNVIVFSNAGAYSLPVAEHAFSLILTLAKGLNKEMKRIESYQITGKNIVILGAGGIGSEVARIAKNGFKMKTIGVSRSFKEDTYDEKYSLKDIDNVIPLGDVIVDSLPLNKETNGILNYERLSKMKNKAILVNVGRAETIVEDDIIRILKERPDVRFGTDVFWRKNGKENYDSELWKMQNFAGSLHTAGGYASKEVLDNAMIRACKNLANYINYGKAENQVKISDYI
ncbi:3-phosphoglycerate dehydrogenase [Acidianus sulfidivorans JP7]|uniref:3-phosphoglycerate dehydrogenase n=1 Tax=Acidianus sulfidivorans JP7 TaxID=619593 RepID=A0A2U9IL61_9CREN|nr:2-hydroxyacid dehydrogenase [Acidianus sulfidivorans]AWR96757.1 3-phosphoglycerate dehydrogenase [Acidianus sulfidivorans JP7]